MSKYCVCLLKPLTLIVSMDWRFEVTLISALVCVWSYIKLVFFHGWGHQVSGVTIYNFYWGLLLHAKRVLLNMAYSTHALWSEPRKNYFGFFWFISFIMQIEMQIRVIFSNLVKKNLKKSWFIFQNWCDSIWYSVKLQ